MKIEAEIPSLKKIILEIDEKTTVDQLRNILCKKLGLEPNLTTIIQKGTPVPGEIQANSLPDKKIELDYLWARQALIWGLKGQKHLRKAKIFLAGAGSLGNETAKNLALMGIGNLTIADYDKIETSNLSRCIFFDKEDVGKYKAETLVAKLRKKYPFTSFKVYNRKVEEIPEEEFLLSDLVISGLDNLSSRIFLTTVSNKYRVPLVDGGMISNQCRIQAFIPGETPCPICIVPVLNYGQLTGLRNPCSAPIEDGVMPSLMTSTSLVSALQSSEAVKLIFHRLKKQKLENIVGQPIKGVLIIDLQYNRFTHLPLKKNPNCFVCGKKGIAKEPIRILETSIGSQTPNYERIVKDIKERLKTMDKPKLYVNKDGTYINLTKNEDLKKTGIHKGSYIHVIFKNKDKQYKEVIIKLN